jgi:Coenzyme F390 synthetase
VPGGLIPASSGGTTGDTLHFHIDRIRQAQDHAARLFMQSLFGVLPGARRLHLWGSPIEARARWLRRFRDRLINERLVSAFDLSSRRLDAYLDVLTGWQPAVVYGYPSAVAALAYHAIDRGRSVPPGRIRLVVLTGEEIYPHQREVIRAAFGAPVASEYGNREVGLIAHECPHGSLHVITPHVHVEILRGGEPVALGQAGEIVCTTLGTRGQPMIRYRVGDLGRLLDCACPCGLPLPL